MLRDDQTLADEVYLMGRDHFNKLASLAVKMQGARELGVLAAHSKIGTEFLPDAVVLEKMAEAYAEKTAVALNPHLRSGIGGAVGGALLGSGVGLATADEGQELKRGLQGAGIGAGLGAAGMAGLSGLRSIGRAKAVPREIAEEAAERLTKSSPRISKDMSAEDILRAHGQRPMGVEDVDAFMGVKGPEAEKAMVESLGMKHKPKPDTLDTAAANFLSAKRAQMGSKTAAADLEKLGATAYSELGEEHMTKLASQIVEGEISWDDLSEMEKVAIGWMGKALGGLKKGVQFFTKGKNVKIPGAPGSGGGVGSKLREGWNVMTGKGKTPTMPKTPKVNPKVQSAMDEAKALKSTPGGAKTMAGGSGGPYRTPGKTTGTPSTPGQPPAPKPGKKWYQPSMKTQLALGAAGVGGTYLGGKALDAGTAFLTPQPPGTAYQYGGGSPSHFMRSQMGM